MSERLLITLEVVIFAAILLTALYLQLILGERPCPLCLLQRLFMIAVGTAVIFNLRFGSHPRYYALAILAALCGGAIALRQIAFHVCPCFPKFGIPFWGISLYTWSFLIFALSIAYNALLLTLCSPRKNRQLSWIESTAIAFLLLAALLNVGVTLRECGLGPCRDVPFEESMTR